MTPIYMTHPYHGATHAYDRQEVERNEKAGWKVTPMPSAAEILRQKGAARAAELKAEAAKLEDAVAALDVPPPDTPKPAKVAKVRRAPKQ